MKCAWGHIPVVYLKLQLKTRNASLSRREARVKGNNNLGFCEVLHEIPDTYVTSGEKLVAGKNDLGLMIPFREILHEIGDSLVIIHLVLR
jgi:hypothetical protein